VTSKALSPETRQIVNKSLERFAGWFGVWLSTIRTEIRIGVHFTAAEFRLMIQWSLFVGLMSLMSETSPFYADATDSSKKLEAIRYHIEWVTNALVVGANQIAEFQKTALEVTEAIHARAELEKAYFIKKFDDLDKDLRDIEKRKKALKIGDWAVGTLKNLFSYDADFFEFERSQRDKMGLPEFDVGITGPIVTDMREQPQVQEAGYDHRAPADEDAD
jgi:hypothetical protein